MKAANGGRSAAASHPWRRLSSLDWRIVRKIIPPPLQCITWNLGQNPFKNPPVTDVDFVADLWQIICKIYGWFAVEKIYVDLPRQEKHINCYVYCGAWRGGAWHMETVSKSPGVMLRPLRLCTGHYTGYQIWRSFLFIPRVQDRYRPRWSSHHFHFHTSVPAFSALISADREILALWGRVGNNQTYLTYYPI